MTRSNKINQPPSGGCVLKPIKASEEQSASSQPPSGGCVLKLKNLPLSNLNHYPAAFGRLCVETKSMGTGILQKSTSRLRAAVC